MKALRIFLLALITFGPSAIHADEASASLAAERLKATHTSRSADLEREFTDSMERLDAAYVKELDKLAVDHPDEAKAEKSRFESEGSPAKAASPVPDIATHQERYAALVGQYKKGHAGSKAALASEYLFRLCAVGANDYAKNEHERLAAATDLSLAADGRVDIFPSADALVRSGEYKNENFGGEDRLMVRNPPSGGTRRRFYIRFPLKNLRAPVTNARLRLVCVENFNNAQRQQSIYLCENDVRWSEGTITYAKRPSTGRELLAYICPILHGIIYIDLTDALNDALKARKPTLDLSFATESTQYISYGSKENESEWARPRLIVNDAGSLMAAASGGKLPPYELFPPPPGSSESGAAVVTTNVPATDMLDTGSAVPGESLPLKGTIKKIKSLLVTGIRGGDLIGMAQNLTITAVKTGSDEPLDLRFNQKVGDDMRLALNAAIRGLQIRHQAWPRGYAVELAFEDKYVGKDGPSAAVASALLIEALVRDAEIDPKFAVTGDMNSDLSVQPIGGVGAKMEGAISRKCTVMAIPAENRVEAEDVLVLDGLSKFATLQLFTIKDFAQAEALAFSPRPDDVQKSINQFVTLRDAGLSDFRSEATRNVLREILERTPNHLSAELLLLASLGRTPDKLSLNGSFQAIDRVTAPFIGAILSKRPKQIAKSEFSEAMIKLQQITKKLDDRTVPLHTATIDLFVNIRRHVGQKFSNRTQYEAAIRDLDTFIARYKKENEAIASNKEIREELLR